MPFYGKAGLHLNIWSRLTIASLLMIQCCLCTHFVCVLCYFYSTFAYLRLEFAQRIFKMMPSSANWRCFYLKFSESEFLPSKPDEISNFSSYIKIINSINTITWTILNAPWNGVFSLMFVFYVCFLCLTDYHSDAHIIAVTAGSVATSCI